MIELLLFPLSFHSSRNLFFFPCKCLNEVIKTLQKFLDNKNEKKESSIEAVILKVVATLVKFNGPRISSKSIWNELMQEVPGILNEKNPNEYNTNDYGTIYRTSTLSGYLGDSFGGVVKHGKKGNDWTFDPKTIKRLAKEDKTRIAINKHNNNGYPKKEGEGVNTVNTPDRGGSTEIQEKVSIGNEETKSEIEEEQENIEKNINPFPYMPSQPSPIHPSSSSPPSLLPQSTHSKIKAGLFTNQLISVSDLLADEDYDYDLSIDKESMQKTGERNVWLIRAGDKGQGASIALENNCVGIGYGGLPGLHLIKDFEKFKEHYKKTHPEDNKYQVAKVVPQIWNFMYKINIGDFVLLPLAQKSNALAVGKIIGEYQYEHLHSEIEQYRRVHWLKKNINKDEFDSEIQRSFDDRGTVHYIGGWM